MGKSISLIKVSLDSLQQILRVQFPTHLAFCVFFNKHKLLSSPHVHVLGIWRNTWGCATLPLIWGSLLLMQLFMFLNMTCWLHVMFLIFHSFINVPSKYCLILGFSLLLQRGLVKYDAEIFWSFHLIANTWMVLSVKYTWSYL